MSLYYFMISSNTIWQLCLVSVSVDNILSTLSREEMVFTKANCVMHSLVSVLLTTL
jgi:hypothetical protein